VALRGDGDSTLKVFDLDGSAVLLKHHSPPAATTRVDEMALTADGEHLLTVNNAEDRPTRTCSRRTATATNSSVRELSKITISGTAFPGTPAIEQPTWDPHDQALLRVVPILGKPGGCGTATCDGGDGDRSDHRHAGSMVSVLSIRPRTPVVRSATADPTAPRSDRMTT